MITVVSMPDYKGAINMSDPLSDLSTESYARFRPSRPFFIGIDSDGSALDSMEIKQKRCFVPNMIRHFDLEPVAEEVRQVAEFTGLYSKWRGLNRFHTLAQDFVFLGRHAGIARRGFRLPDSSALTQWIAQESILSGGALKNYFQSHPGEFLQRVVAWSDAIERSIGELTDIMPPFPFVRESLAAASERADLAAISAAPQKMLSREWNEHGLDSLMTLLAGQEMGGKEEQLRLAAASRYTPRRILMIGDAPGDLQAARSVGGLFYPIFHGREAECWERFYKESLDLFLMGLYAGDYEAALLEEFDRSLPATPPWEEIGLDRTGSQYSGRGEHDARAL